MKDGNMVTVISIINEILHYSIYYIPIAGIFVSLWGYKKSRKIGYVMIAVYFLVTLALPPLSRYLMEKNPEYIQTKKYLDEAHANAFADLNKRYPDKFSADTKIKSRVSKVPLCEIILLFGIVLLIIKEPDNNRQNVLGYTEKQEPDCK